MKKKVLFLCTGNSCRSQMAEGFLRQLGGDRFEVFSAGVNPTTINPLAIKVMAEIGLDISGQSAKPVSEFVQDDLNYLITVCDNARQACPLFPGQQEKIHWNLEDPAEARGTEEEKLKVFRETRDKIAKLVEEWLLPR